MKKVVCVVLVFTLCLALCACSLDTKSGVIGKWEGFVVGREPVDDGMHNYFVFQRGGIGYHELVMDEYKNPEWIITYDFTWEITDGVLVINYEDGVVAIMQYNPSEGTLIREDGRVIMKRVS